MARDCLAALDGDCDAAERCINAIEEAWQRSEGATQGLWLVNLTDVTPRRATVTSVYRVEAEVNNNLEAREYAYVRSGDLVPEVGERVWIAPWTASRGEREITARGGAS